MPLIIRQSFRSSETVQQAKLKLSKYQEQTVTLTMMQAAEMKGYDYPWDGLEGELEELHGGSLKLLGYGSLIDRKSAARTLTSETVTPTVAIGVRRIFNYEIKRLGPPAIPRAALNVIVTQQREDLVNGMLTEVPIGDIKPLRDRELQYSLKPVTCIDWNNRNEPPFISFILERPDVYLDERSKYLQPDLRYYQLCRGGALDVDEEFLQMWLDTTYLADGKTLVREWEANSLHSGDSPN